MSAPEPGASPRLIYARNDRARQITAGSASATPTAPEVREQADHALAGIPATGAQEDGEPDPLYYLRDELDARQPHPPQGHRGSS